MQDYPRRRESAAGGRRRRRFVGGRTFAGRTRFERLLCVARLPDNVAGLARAGAEIGYSRFTPVCVRRGWLATAR